MNQQQFINMVEQHHDEVLQRRGFTNMASALATLAHIDPNGNQLIFLIGRGNESTNLEALTGWVKKTYLNTMPWDYDSHDALTDLNIKLQNVLEQWHLY